MKKSTGDSGRTANHWLLHRDESRRRIDANAIVEKAHALVHEGGTTALTMRTIASALKTSTSALYRHVPSKEWLLIAIVDYVLAELDTSAAYENGRSPRKRIEHLSASLRDVLTAHPHLHEILASHVAITPNTVSLADAGLTALRNYGVSDKDLIEAYNAWCGYVIGFTIIEAKPPRAIAAPELRKAMRAQLRAANVVDVPLVGSLLPAAGNQAYGLRWKPERLGRTKTSFEWGLASFLDGLERRARSRGSSRS